MSNARIDCLGMGAFHLGDWWRAQIGYWGGADEFEFADIPTLALYFDGGDLPASGNISSWTDRVAEMTISEGTEAEQPTVSTVGPASYRCALFDGVDDELSDLNGPVFDATQDPMTYFVAGAAVDETAVQRFGGIGTILSNQVVVFRSQPPSTDNPYWRFNRDGASNLVFEDLDSSTDRESGSADFDYESGFVAGFRGDLTNGNYGMAIYDQFGYASRDIAGGSTGTGFTNLDSARIAREVASYGNVKVAFILEYTDYLSDTDFRNVMDLLATKLGL